MTPTDSLERARGHVVRFNTAVLSDDWSTFSTYFGAAATMDFVGVPVPGAVGRPAILAAYLATPPTDTMAVLSAVDEDGADVIRFAWTHGGTGTLRITWADDLVHRLVVAFDADPRAGQESRQSKRP